LQQLLLLWMQLYYNLGNKFCPSSSQDEKHVPVVGSCMPSSSWSDALPGIHPGGNVLGKSGFDTLLKQRRLLPSSPCRWRRQWTHRLHKGLHDRWHYDLKRIW
jgi:hypothetical protein